jgi:hypothetical protein
MTTFQKKILLTFIPYILGFAFAYGVMAFVAWDRNAGNWLFSDRMFAVVIGLVVGSMLYKRFEHDRV